MDKRGADFFEICLHPSGLIRALTYVHLPLRGGSVSQALIKSPNGAAVRRARPSGSLAHRPDVFQGSVQAARRAASAENKSRARPRSGRVEGWFDFAHDKRFDMWQVYILRCEDGSLYTGITENLDRRFKEHLSGKGGRHTRLCRPTEIIFSEDHKTQDSAEQREQQIKRWSKAKKLALAKSDKAGLRKLSISRD